MNEEELLARRNALLKQAENERAYVEYYAQLGELAARRLRGSQEALREINAEGNALQFELLLRLSYRRFCKLFNI
jgi:hypothetical protein